MLTALRNNKSLTFYQTTESRSKFEVDSSYTGGMSSTAIATTAHTITNITNTVTTASLTSLLIVFISFPFF